MYASPWIADTYALTDDDRILDAIFGCVPIVLEVPSAFQRAMPSIFSSHSSCMCSQDSQRPSIASWVIAYADWLRLMACLHHIHTCPFLKAQL